MSVCAYQLIKTSVHVVYLHQLLLCRLYGTPHCQCTQTDNYLPTHWLRCGRDTCIVGWAETEKRLPLPLPKPIPYKANNTHTTPQEAVNSYCVLKGSQITLLYAYIVKLVHQPSRLNTHTRTLGNVVDLKSQSFQIV